MRQRIQWRTFAVFCGALLVLGSAQWRVAAQAPAKRPIGYDVMDYWRSIDAPRLSRDGQWLAYAVTSRGEDGELIIRNTKSGQEIRQPRGTNPTFTPDGKLVIFTVALPRAEEDAAAAAAGGEAPAAAPAAAGGRAGGRGGAGGGRGSLAIMTLADGKVTTIDRVGTFKMPEESSTWLAYHHAAAGGGRNGGGRNGAAPGGGRGARGAAGAGGAPAAAPAGETGAAAEPAIPQEKRITPGTDLVLRNLVTSEETTIPEVGDFDWNKDGSWLVYAVASAKPENDGAFARKTVDASVVPLQKGHGHFASFTFDTPGAQLAFLSDHADFDKKVSAYRLYYWKPGDPAATEIVSTATKGMPAGMVVSENGAPRFSRDGARLFLGTAPPPPPAEPGAKAPTKVDLWSYKDPLLQPNQQLQAAQERNRNYRAVVFLADKRFVQLATPVLPNVNPGEDPVRTMGSSPLPYQQEISWDTSYNDEYLIDLRTGGSKKILEHYNGSVSLSPGAGYVLYFDEASGNWFTYRIADGTRTNLTASLSAGASPVKFANQRHDTPDLPPTIGSAGWTEGDKSVLLYDQYDIWEIHPDGTGARMVTNGEGRKQHLVFRLSRAFDDAASGAPAGGGGGRGGGAGGGGADRAVSSVKALLLSTTDEVTRASGFYRTMLTGTAAPEKLLMIDKAVGAPQKARVGDVTVFTESRFDEFPDLWVSDSNFTSPTKVSNANPQQAEYVWGKAEKMQYANADGKKLDALLIKPDNFDPSKKYPLMIYIYEELSDGLHGYRAPNVSTSINVTRYVSNGYIVLEPDIVYGTGHPGQDAMKCVIPAINTVVAQGYVDPKRIGIQGHSWGGYQIAYMVSHTNIFAAVEAGAAVANMTSAYGGIRWGTGVVREMQYEKGQSRIGAAPWDDPLEYLESSPLFSVKNVHTPYLTIANDADTAVPWEQGIEFFTALRRLGKEAYMFVFNGEAHSLGNRDNQKYFTVHMDEFFDHYLLGKPLPTWMEKGVPFLQKGTRDVSPLFKKPVMTPAPAGKGGGH